MVFYFKVEDIILWEIKSRHLPLEILGVNAKTLSV